MWFKKKWGGYDQIKDKEQHRVTRWRGPRVGAILTTTKDRKVTAEQKEFQVRAGKILAQCWVECSSWAHSLMKQIFIGQEQRVIKTKDSCSQSYHFSRFGKDHRVRHAMGHMLAQGRLSETSTSEATVGEMGEQGGAATSQR